MTASAEDLVRLQHLVETQLGLRLETASAAAVLARRDPTDLDRLERDPGALRALTSDLTTGETYFYRHLEQLEAFRAVALPARLRSNADVVRVLSAGCSTGEEPYTLAILVREAAPEHAARVAIDAIDLDEAAIARAKRARYTRWSLRALPPEIELRWFVKARAELSLVSTIRNAVAFKRANLADPLTLPASHYDIVFCRNVLMYFTEAAARAVIDRLVRALVPGGYLFLGHTDILRDAPVDVTLRESHGTFYYQRSTAPPAMRDRDTAAWFSTIEAASERVRVLADRAASAPEAPVEHDLATSLAAIRERIARDDFAGALAALERLPAAHAGDADVVLLRAVALTEHGDPQRAAAACAKLLELATHAASAHYLLAVCRESAGDLAGAVHHAELATQHAPDFAMAHLRFGLIARHAGDRTAARRELVRAIEALQVEDPQRLALHAGGLGRDALIRMCRTELAAIEVRT